MKKSPPVTPFHGTVSAGPDYRPGSPNHIIAKPVHSPETLRRLDLYRTGGLIGDVSGLTFLLVVFVLPLAVLVISSLSASWSFPELLPEALSLRALQYVSSQIRPILLSLLSSSAYSLLTVGFVFLLSLLPARALARYDFPGKTFVDALLLIPVLLPVMTFSMGIHVIFLRLGLSDTFAGIVLILSIYSYPYMLRALISGYLRIPGQYTTTARNLGGSFLYTLLHVELPMLLPGIAAGASVVFLVAFSEYFLVFLIGGGAVPSYTGYLFPFLQGSDHSIASLLALIFLVIPLLLFFLMEGIISTIYKKRGLEA